MAQPVIDLKSRDRKEVGEFLCRGGAATECRPYKYYRSAQVIVGAALRGRPCVLTKRGCVATLTHPASSAYCFAQFSSFLDQ